MFSGSPDSSSRSPRALSLGQILSIIGVLAYTLVLGIGIMGNQIVPERSYLLIALPCLVPAVWYLVGFLRNDGGDYGLVASSLGWFLVALALLTRHLTIQGGINRGLRPDQISDTSVTWLFAILAVAGIIGGAVLSARYWLSKST